MFAEIRARARARRRRASITKLIGTASRPQRDELIVMAQRQGLL